MSEEVLTAAADLATVEALRARVLEWEDCYDRLLGAFELHMEILDCKQAMADYAGAFYDVIVGDLADQYDQALAELKLLRELAADVARWRESSDARDLRYVLETADKYDAAVKGNTHV